MSNRTIVAMPGDGIGKVVLDEAIKVLNKAGLNADYVEADIGWEFWCSENLGGYLIGVDYESSKQD